MATEGEKGTGDDPLEGADPGGTRSTRPGNPDKGGSSKPETAGESQEIVSGDQNNPEDERAR